MCGITGIVAFNQLGRLHMINLAGATEQLASRGPDFQLTYHDEFVGLGHRRLSIIDPSPAGHQPMQDASGRYALIYNGEIYNYKSLRQQLESKGVHFESDTDTEVLLYLLIERGIECLEELNGFFAFAFYDKQEHKLIIARDRFGIKPLVYAQDQDKIVFASEMKSLYRYGIEKKIDRSSLQMYLQLNYIPAPFSILQGAKKLEPGHYLEIYKNQVSDHCYYQLPESDEDLGDYKSQKLKFAQLLEESVADRLVSDVPLGTFLSGGLDSSIVTALAARNKDDLQTFSIGYREEKYFDETRYAEMAARHLGTKHTVFNLSNRDMFDHLFNILDYLDEPFADSSAIAVNVLSRETRNHVKVALSGDGADELLAGYNKHEAIYRMLYPGITEKLISGFGPLWNSLPQSRNGMFGDTFRKLNKFSRHFNESPEIRYWGLASFMSESQASNLLLQNVAYDFDKTVDRNKHYLGPFNKYGDTLDAVLRADLGLVLPNDMLTKVDMMSMANSLEVRVPFLDHRVVNFVMNLPEESKIGRNIRKRILRDSFKDILPRKIFSRPKHGFEVPLLKWFRRDMKSLINDDLLEEDSLAEQQIFNVEEISKLKRKLFSNNPGDVHATIWALVVFQWWYRKYMT